MQITVEDARKVLALVDAGLVAGIGKPIPGQMRIEQVACSVLGLLNDDDPQCASRALRLLEIRLGECGWSSHKARGKGLRRLALAQLGSAGPGLDDSEFSKRTATLAITKFVPLALRAAASIHTHAGHKQAMLDAANKCETEGAEAPARARKVANSASCYAGDAAGDAANAAAYAAAYAAYAAYTANPTAAAAAAAAAADAYAYAANAARAHARDQVLEDFAEGVVQILIEMGAPGCQWLSLTEAA
jgi:hypothetical protein